MRWLISVPVWGRRCVDEFCASVLPALDRAALFLATHHGADVRLVVHTDEPERIDADCAARVETRPVPAGARDFDCMSQAHREVLGMALRGDVVVLLTAGAVVSEQALLYCSDVFADNPRLRVVLCAVPRVLAAGQIPDTGDAQGLARWAWDNRHPMTRECTWPLGRSRDLSRTFFEDAAGVCARVALPHPLAVRVDGRQLRFTPTVDANLIHCFDPTEMHVATSCDRLTVLKLTPADKGYDVVPETMEERARAGQLVIGDPHQRWSMSHVVRWLPGYAGDGAAAFASMIRER